jgi:hypothetical protein
MDGSSNLVVGLIAVSLWFFGVWALYFFFIRHEIKKLDNLSRLERAAIFETRRQRYIRIFSKKPSKD